MAEETRQKVGNDINIPPLSRQDFYTFLIRLFYTWTKLTDREEEVLVQLMLASDEGLITTAVKTQVQFDLRIVNLGGYMKTFKDKNILIKGEGRNYRVAPYLMQDYDSLEKLTFHFNNSNYEKQ